MKAVVSSLMLLVSVASFAGSPEKYICHGRENQEVAVALNFASDRAYIIKGDSEQELEYKGLIGAFIPSHAFADGKGCSVEFRPSHDGFYGEANLICDSLLRADVVSQDMSCQAY